MTTTRTVASVACGLLALAAFAHGCGSDAGDTDPVGQTTTTTPNEGGGGGGAQGGTGGTGTGGSSGAGAVGGTGGAGGEGGGGMGPTEQPTGQALVSGGVRASSSLYRVVYSFGQSSMHQEKGQAPNYWCRGGLVPSME